MELVEKRIGYKWNFVTLMENEIKQGKKVWGKLDGMSEQRVMQNKNLVYLIFLSLKLWSLNPELCIITVIRAFYFKERRKRKK